MRNSHAPARPRARSALPSLFAALCLAGATTTARPGAAAGLDAFGEDAPRLVEPRIGGPAALDGADLVPSLLPVGLGVPDRSLAALVTAALDTAAASAGSGPARAAAPKLGAIVSGLTWRSGASCGPGAFETWRGRKLDVTAVSVGRRDWATMIRNIGEPTFKANATAVPQLVIILPMLPVSAFKQFAACAAGDFDARYRAIGGALKQAGAGNAVLRLGWEANIGSRSHPWGYDTAADAKGYVKCFRRAAGVLKSVAPGVKIEWSNAKAGEPPFSLLAANPGDDVTDLWGLHYYNVDGQFNTQKAWDEFYVKTRLGGPQGLGAWLTEAKKRGKKLSVPEWGITKRDLTAAVADGPLYIQNMYNTFKANAATIAFENYFNCKDVHQIHPRTLFPKSSAQYRKLWLQGR